MFSFILAIKFVVCYVLCAIIICTTFVHKVPRLSLQKKNHLFRELSNIYLNRYVSKLYGQRLYMAAMLLYSIAWDV
jgi:hypothetical protein